MTDRREFSPAPSPFANARKETIALGAIDWLTLAQALHSAIKA